MEGRALLFEIQLDGDSGCCLGERLPSSFFFMFFARKEKSDYSNNAVKLNFK